MGRGLHGFRLFRGGRLNDYLLSIILGIIEGLTEFLPVSSTAHLRISEALLGIDLGNGFWKMYSIVIQLGAILCLPIYFRQRIARILSTLHSESGLDALLGVLLLLGWLPLCFFCLPAWADAFGRVLKPSGSGKGSAVLTHPLMLVSIAFV